MSSYVGEESPAVPALTVMIATHDNVAILRRCLASWEQFGPAGGLEIIVIADGCSDGTQEYLRQTQATPWGQRTLRWVEEADVHELRCTNRGLRQARGALAMSWHDDMFLDRTWMIPEIIATFDAYPDLGLLGLSRGLTCAPFDAPIRTWADSVDWRRLRSTIGSGPLNWLRLSEVDGIVRPWVVRRACVERVGSLDEAFGLTEWDEADLCFRIRNAGWRIAAHGYERDGAYTHLLSSTLGRLPDATRQAMGLRNALVFHARWHEQIAREHPRKRRTWWRRMDFRGAVSLLGALVRSIEGRLNSGSTSTALTPPTVVRRLRRLVWSLVPDAVQHRVVGRRYGFREARVQLDATITPFADSFRLQLEDGGTLYFPRDVREDVEYHFSSNGASMEEMFSLVKSATPGGLLFDIGAHHGLFAHMFCIARRDTRAVAYEPSDTLRRVCLTMRGMNALEQRLHVESLAIGAAIGTMTGSLQSNGLAAFGPSAGDHLIEFATTTVDAECVRLGLRPTVLKIDVEGYEHEVLLGAQQLLADHAPVILLELHVDLLAERGKHVRDVVQELLSLGYTFFEHTGAPLSPARLVRTRGGVVRCLARR